MPVIVSSRRLEDPDGREFAIVTFTDISDQKSAEAQLRDANVRLELRQKEMDEDLALAARVQQSLAPKSIVWGGLRVDTYYHPVRTIGGDFGLVSPLDERALESAGLRRFRPRHRLGAHRQSHLHRNSDAIAQRRAARGYAAPAQPLRDAEHRQFGLLLHARGGAHRARRPPHGFCRRRPSRRQ